MEDENRAMKAQLAALLRCVAAFVEGYEAGEHGSLESCPLPPTGRDAAPREWWLRGFDCAKAVRDRRFLEMEITRLRQQLGEDPS